MMSSPKKTFNWQLRALIFCLLIFIISRYFFFLEYSFIEHALIKSGKSVVENLWRWDSEHYAGIALNGYDTTYHLGGNYVWFPLWPLILKIISLNGLFPLPETSILLNQLILFSCLLVFYNYLNQLGFKTLDIQYGVILLAFAPTNIYFFAGLTEPSFLLLSLTAFYSLEKDKVWLAVIIGSLLGVTKIVGIMFIVPFIYYSYSRYKLNKTFILQCIILCIPLSAHMLYLQIHVGDYLAFIHAQRAPGFARPGFDLSGNIIAQVYTMFQKATIYDVSAFAISLIVTTIILWYYRLKQQALFNLFCIIPIFISGGLWNSFRMCFSLFTAYLAAVVVSRNSLTIKMLILIASIAMTWVCWLFWLSGSWIFA
ncbi:MAG: hypothetical protein K0R14_451 [Burkholderiales bacterium]|jgi:hypothetical protein|nr:hypothetical protein [Burkholderiales bacterium]